MDPGELELRPLDAEPSEPDLRPRASSARIVAIALIASAAIAAYVVFFWGRPASVIGPVARGPAVVAAPVEAPTALGGTPEPYDVPPLDQSDTFVRQMFEQISHHPTVLAWLATRNLIRTFTVSVLNIADGASPAPHLAALHPSARFTVVQRDGAAYIDPGTYDRYTVLADGVRSIDVQAAARVYATLKPRINEAYRDLGYPGQSFDGVLQRAIVALLDTPTIDGPIRLRPKGGTGYRYDDERLEQLTAAQKQLLRMGPQNARLVKEALRSVGIALGINPRALSVK